jgi:multisubunit Na+/H+ antiporter MnhF subunit
MLTASVHNPHDGFLASFRTLAIAILVLMLCLFVLLVLAGAQSSGPVVAFPVGFAVLLTAIALVYRLGKERERRDQAYLSAVLSEAMGVRHVSPSQEVL